MFVPVTISLLNAPGILNIELAISKTAFEADSAEEEEEAISVVVAINDAAADDDSTTIAAASWSAFVLRLLPRHAFDRDACSRDRRRQKSRELGELTRRLDRAVKSDDDVEDEHEGEEVEATAVLCWQPAVSRIVLEDD